MENTDGKVQKLKMRLKKQKISKKKLKRKLKLRFAQNYLKLIAKLNDTKMLLRQMKKNGIGIGGNALISTSGSMIEGQLHRVNKPAASTTVSNRQPSDNALDTAMDNEIQLKQSHAISHGKMVESESRRIDVGAVQGIIGNNDFEDDFPNSELFEEPAISETALNRQPSDIAPDTVMENQINAYDVQLIHSYAMPHGKKSKIYQCTKCKYRTDKKFNLEKHEENSHEVKQHDMKCPICEKPFTYDGLRGHLNYFV